MRYWYDDTFEGLLTAVFEAYSQKEDPEILSGRGGVQLSLDGLSRSIRTDPEKAERVWRGVERRMSVHALQLFYTAWLGESPEVPTLVLHAIRGGMRRGADILGNFQDSRIQRLNELYRKVNKEVHFFTGTLRFRLSPSGVLYAGYEPDGNITELLAPHFVERFSCEQFLIHDLKRGNCAVFDGRETTLTVAPPDARPPVPDGEDDFERLWRHYYRAIAVEGRTNNPLRRRFLPARYWKHLTELQPDLTPSAEMAQVLPTAAARRGRATEPDPAAVTHQDRENIHTIIP
jgi:probable DNA metabolism protein